MKNVGVIGAGTMGQGIANAFATAGYHVTVCDIKIEWAQNGINKICAKLDKFVSCSCSIGTVTNNVLLFIHHSSYSLISLYTIFDLKENFSH